MTWLDNLWFLGLRDYSARETIQAALPDTNILFKGYSSTGDGWRDLQNYKDMRDLLGEPYGTG